MIHFFQEFDHIKVRGGRVTKTVEVQILCGAKTGEADNRPSKVTCPDCRRKLDG